MLSIQFDHSSCTSGLGRSKLLSDLLRSLRPLVQFHVSFLNFAYLHLYFDSLVISSCLLFKISRLDHDRMDPDWSYFKNTKHYSTSEAIKSTCIFCNKRFTEALYRAKHYLVNKKKGINVYRYAT